MSATDLKTPDQACRIPDERRCTKKSKQRSRASGKPERCRQPVVQGRKECHYHGGVIDTSKRPHAPNLKHGLYSTVLDPKLRSDSDAAIQSVQADGGVLAVESGIGVRVAAVTRFYREHPEGPATPEERDALMQALTAIDKAAATRKELLAEAPKADAPFTITIGQPGSDRVMVRTPNGPVTALRAPEGGLLLPDGRGAYVPAVQHDVDGIEVWSPTLELNGTGGNE